MSSEAIFKTDILVNQICCRRWKLQVFVVSTSECNSFFVSYNWGPTLTLTTPYISYNKLLKTKTFKRSWKP